MIGGTRLKQRLLPLCAFLSAFTVVMTILVYSTDIRGRRYQRIQLNLSIATDFQNAGQDDPQLIEYIREHHLKLPTSVSLRGSDRTTLFSQPEFANVFEWKKNGVFIETGAYRHGDESRTYWLERALGWRGLLTQPDPHDYNILKEHCITRSNSYTANVCLSPTSNPKTVSFRQSHNNHSQVPQLIQVQCFPLYSLLLAINATNIDYLSLEAENAEFQVLKTLPFHKVNIRVIGIAVSTESNKEFGSEISRITKLLSAYGYKLNQTLSSKKQYLFVCSKGYNGCSAPRITI